jgi:dihydroxyacetone kinase
MGIHNEPGVSKQKMTSVASIVDKLLSTITDTSDKDRGFVPFKGMFLSVLEGGMFTVLSDTSERR